MKSLINTYGSVCAVFVLGAVACGGPDVTCLDADGQPASCEAPSAENTEGNNELSDSPSVQERLEQVQGDLGVGSRGADVRAVHEYLAEYGYLPNDELRLRYPMWRPIVAEGPADLEVYDELTLEAVSQLQRNSGLRVTGNVDGATRALLRMERCGVPDGIAFDPSEKFALFSRTLADTTLTWRVINVNGMTNSNLVPTVSCTPQPSCGTTARTNSIRDAFRAAFASWARTTDVTFTELTSGTADIQIGFVASTPGIMNAPLSPTTTPMSITVESQKNWFVGNAVAPAGEWYDVQTTALHEIGHLLGLLHSTVTAAASTPGADAFGSTMTSAIIQRRIDRALHPDDNVAASLLYESWNPVPPVVLSSGANFGPAQDIAVGKDTVWVVGGDLLSVGGFSIRQTARFNDVGGPGWSAHLSGGQGALRIAAGLLGRPWIINGANQVMERNPAGTAWELRGTASNCATDIGVGGTSGNGTAWILGCTPNANGDFSIFRWTGSVWEQPNPGAKGTRITVDGRGVPWIVNSLGDVWRRPTASGQWEFVSGTALDIGAGPGATAFDGSGISYVYVTAPDQTIWAWDEQPIDPVDTCTAGPGQVCPVTNWSPARFGFAGSAIGFATTVAVSPFGSPWVIASDGSIWAQTH